VQTYVLCRIAVDSGLTFTDYRPSDMAADAGLTPTGGEARLGPSPSFDHNSAAIRYRDCQDKEGGDPWLPVDSGHKSERGPTSENFDDLLGNFPVVSPSLGGAKSCIFKSVFRHSSLVYVL
jgi:hypothetical protein